MVAGTGWSSSGNSEEEAIVGRIENSTLVAIVRCQRNKQKQGPRLVRWSHPIVQQRRAKTRSEERQGESRKLQAGTNETRGGSVREQKALHALRGGGRAKAAHGHSRFVGRQPLCGCFHHYRSHPLDAAVVHSRFVGRQATPSNEVSRRNRETGGRYS